MDLGLLIHLKCFSQRQSRHSLIQPEALERFSSYLQVRQKFVSVVNLSSSWCHIDYGVPQGRKLSTQLFALFINFFTTELHSLNHLYANDLQLYAQANIEDLAIAIDKVMQISRLSRTGPRVLGYRLIR